MKKSSYVPISPLLPYKGTKLTLFHACVSELTYNHCEYDLKHLNFLTILKTIHARADPLLDTCTCHALPSKSAFFRVKRGGCFVLLLLLCLFFLETKSYSAFAGLNLTMPLVMSAYKK